MKPCESHILNHLEYSTTGDKILVCAGNAQPKVRNFKHTFCAAGDVKSNSSLVNNIE